MRSLAQAFSQAEIDKGTTINKVPALVRNGDSGVAVVIPEANANCARMVHERVFWQVDQPKEHQYSYLLVDRLWKKAPESVRSAVVLHESIWKYERSHFRPQNSQSTQYFNAVIHANEFKNYSSKDYLAFLNDTHFCAQWNA